MRYVLSILSVATIQFALAGVVLADINVVGFGNSSIQSPLFELSQAGSPSGNMLSFDYDQSSGDQASLGTCTMNPMSGSINDVIIAQLPLPDEPAFFLMGNSPLPDPPTTTPTTIPSTHPTTRPTTEPSENVPEPSTFLILGIGAAGLLPLARRYRRKDREESPTNE